MMEEMYATTTASKSACPSPDDYMKSFEGAEQYRRCDDHWNPFW